MDLHHASPLEQLLARFWDDIVGTQASRHTDFFSAGTGDAEARRLLTLVEEAFRIEMPLSVLRSAPTVAALAGALKRQVDHPGRLERVAERLLHHDVHAVATQRGAHRAGARL